MFEMKKAQALFDRLLSRPDVTKAYEMKNASDSWFDTLKTVHESLATLKANRHDTWEIIADDSITLRAVHYACPNARGNVIFVHGYTSHAEREWAFPALFYLSRGFNVVIPYQRAHGLSEGKYVTFGALERDDMLRWISKTAMEHPDLPTVVHGLSMGGGIALQLCNADCPTLKAVVADAPSESIDRLFTRALKEENLKNPEKIHQCLHAIFRKATGKDVEATDVRPYVAESKIPVLLAAGSKENSEKRLTDLAESCPQKAEVVILQGCNHGNGMYKQTETFQTAIKNFLNEVLC